MNSEELFELQRSRGLRAPLVATFADLGEGEDELVDTADFIFVVNHLARTNAESRREQAEGLVTWVQQQEIPVLPMGDFNFDWDISDEEGNAAFNIFIEGGHWTWVEPAVKVKTEDSDAYDSILDFAFVANIPMGGDEPLPFRSTILERSGDVAASTLDFDDDATETEITARSTLWF